MTSIHLNSKKIRSFVLKNIFNIFIFVSLSIHTLFSGRWWAWNAFSIIPPVFFTLVLVVLIVWNIIRKNKAGIIFIILSLPLVVLNSDINLNIFHADENKTNAITIFNLNTEYWETSKKEDFYKFLLSKNADIYQLQEHVDRNFEELDDLQEIKGHFVGYHIISSGEFLTISKFPIVKTYNSHGAYYLKNDLDINGKIVSFYNVHIPVQLDPRYINDPFKFIVDLKTRFTFRESNFNLLINDLKNNSNPYYISGDFNTTKSMNKMGPILDLTEDSFSQSKFLIPTTWDIQGVKLWRIDYNLISKNKGLHFLQHDEVDALDFSDHWGQFVTIEAK